MSVSCHRTKSMIYQPTVRRHGGLGLSSPSNMSQPIGHKMCLTTGGLASMRALGTSSLLSALSGSTGCKSSPTRCLGFINAGCRRTPPYKRQARPGNLPLAWTLPHQTAPLLISCSCITNVLI